MKKKSSKLFQEVQDNICSALLKFETESKFIEDLWQRNTLESTGANFKGGGGRTRILSNGQVLEKAGVNFSEVHGNLPKDLSKKLTGKDFAAPFYATGISLVIHPDSPLIPSIHSNYRYLEVGEERWFGGGIDLSPYYLDENEVKLFHSTLNEICSKHTIANYQQFKLNCDDYFYLPHRAEHRGVGGIFFDYLGKGKSSDFLNSVAICVEDLAQSFTSLYLPIIEANISKEWSPEQKSFQLRRRGRYVEFNLLYDRGTQFGLKTGGRTESILMSLPPVVHWDYDSGETNQQSAEEKKLLKYLKNPIDWLNYSPAS